MALLPSSVFEPHTHSTCTTWDDSSPGYPLSNDWSYTQTAVSQS